MKTKQPDDLTNTIMLEIDKVFRKNGLGHLMHPHFDGNRKLIKGMVEIMLASETAEEEG